MTRNFKYFFFVVISTIISTSVFAQRIESFYISATEIEKKLSDDYIGIIQESLNLSKDCELVEKNANRVLVDDFGYTHKRYSQYYKGIKIEETDIIIHLFDNKLSSVNGEYLQLSYLDTTKNISFNLARNIALDFLIKTIPGCSQNDTFLSSESTFEVTICNNKLDQEDTSIHLCYKFDVLVEGMSIHYLFYVDAKTGDVVNYIPLLLNEVGQAATRYSGNRDISTSYNGTKYVLHDNTRGSGIETYNLQHSTNLSNAIDFTDDDNAWTAGEFHNVNKDDGALDAHWGAMMTYDYFKNVHGRNSYDNLNSKLKNYVHYGSAYDNAGWSFANNAMIYGDGGTIFDILTSLDVIGHEIAHGVCQYSAELIYQGESGAINESLSDIWGACIEEYAAPEKQQWLMGEDIVKYGSALRNMSNPKSVDSPQPNTYKGTYWKNTEDVSWANDYGGVHTNSGVMNYWFYLLSEGGYGTNDKGWNYSVSGISMNKAAKIVYRAETVYMTQNTNFINAREYTIAAAKDIYGSNSQEVQSVKDAWYAVGVWADLYIRDSVSDNGLVPSNVHYMWESPDIWIEDLDGNVGNPHGNSICNVCVRIWNRNDIASSGKERLFINWAKAGCDLQWDLNWTGGTHFPCGDNPVTGGVVGSANGMLIQSIPAHGSTVVRIPWVTPMAEDYQNCTQFNAELWHFCLVARVHDGKDIVGESSAPGGMGNFVNDNNNVAWKNISILDAQYNTAVVSFSNPFDYLQRFRLHFRTRPNKAGDIIFKHADVLIRLDDELVRLWKDGGGVCVGGKYLGENRFLVQEPAFYLENIVMPIGRHYTVEAGVRFFTQTNPLCNEFEFDIIEEGEKEIIGGEHYLAIKDPQKRFKAVALEDKTVLSGDSTSFTAQTITEDAQYTWFNTAGDTLAVGELLQTAQNATRQYILEVVSDADNYKDVDTVTVTVRRAAITALTPNPANNQTVVSYRLASDVTSATIVIANATGQVLYSAPLDVTQTTHTVNLLAIPTGQYTVRIESQGSPLDSKTLIVY